MALFSCIQLIVQSPIVLSNHGRFVVQVGVVLQVLAGHDEVLVAEQSLHDARVLVYQVHVVALDVLLGERLLRWLFVLCLAQFEALGRLAELVQLHVLREPLFSTNADGVDLGGRVETDGGLTLA